MDLERSERLMAEAEQRYMSDLQARFGGSLNQTVLNVMVGLYRAGWRDCRAAAQREAV